MKKIKSKRVISILVSLAMLASVFTGMSTVAFAFDTVVIEPVEDSAFGSSTGFKIARGADEVTPVVLQDLDYTENPVDIPNPDRGPYRGRWQRVETPFGMTPEVDHRVPFDENDVLYHGATLVGPGIIGTVEGDDIEETEFYNGVSRVPYYVGGTGVKALPGVSFMTFDLTHFSSNAFLSRQDSYNFIDERTATGALNFVDPVTGKTRTGITRPLSDHALKYIRDLLQTVRDGEGVAFVKFSYDGNGFNYLESWTGYPEQLIYGPEPTHISPNNPSAMCNVPGHEDKDWIQYHIWQLKPIFEEFEDIIMCVKTGMLGPWGEQHSSPQARSAMAYKKLLDAYLDAVPDSRILLTHQGGFMSWYNLTYGTTFNHNNIDLIPAPVRGTPEARIGIYSDSYAANWDDNGSLWENGGVSQSYPGGSNGTYNRRRVLTWVYNQNTITQVEGGIGNNIYGTFPGILAEAQLYRTTVLNMRHGAYQRWNDYIYTEAVAGEVVFPNTSTQALPYTGHRRTVYFDPVYDGRKGLEYIRDRLGYRLLLREAKASEWVEQDGTLRFEGKIQNVGFGNVVNKKDVSVILQSKAGSKSFTFVTELDARDWLTAENGNTRADNTDAWRDFSFQIDLRKLGEVPLGEYDIYLKINDPKEQSANKRCIQFANHDIWNAELGANLIGSTSVEKPLMPQTYDYTENPVDIPNPDRGFYRPQTYVVPVVPGTTPTIPNLSATITGTTVQVNARIVYLEVDLRNFSSNAPISARPAGPWVADYDPNNPPPPPTYGTTQPLTPAALEYIRAAMRQIRNSEAVAILKFNYDNGGRTWIASGGFDRLIHDPEPGAPQGREWYETGRWTQSGTSWSFTGGIRNTDDSCGIPGHEDKNWVQYHMWQLKDIYDEFEDCIMAAKGGWFGPWGEMHSSQYARSAAGYNWLLNALLDYVPESRPILVHAGGVMAWQNVEYGAGYGFLNLPPAPERGTPAQRFGMFNDSYSAGGTGSNPSDNGSLSEGSSLLPQAVRTYNRNAAFNWIRNQKNFYGGETVGVTGTFATNVYPHFPNVPYEAAYARTTHLNTSYNQNTYRLWGDFVYNEENVTAPFTPHHDRVTRTAIFDPVYDGRNGMEFIRDRLGYRLVLREANVSEWVTQNSVLRFEGKLQNVGFGLIVNKKNVSVILKAKDGSATYTALTDLDARDWEPDLDNRPSNTAAYRGLNFSVNLGEFDNVPAGDYDIYMKINDPKETHPTRRSIRFANKGDIWDAALGANLIGSTTVKHEVAPGPAIIEDGAIKVEIEHDMSMTVFQNDGTIANPVWRAITKPIDKMGANGATATGVSGAWKDALPWSVSTGTSTTVGSANFIDAGPKLLSAKSSYVTTGAPNRLLMPSATGGGNAVGETLLSDSFVVDTLTLEENVKTYFSGDGTGNRLTVTGIDSSLGLKHTLVLETGAQPGVIAVSSYYTYLKEGELTVTKFVDNNFKIEAMPLDRLIMNDERGNPDTKRPEAGLWSWQGCDAGSAQMERVAPVFDNMGTGAVNLINAGTGNSMSRANWHWSANRGVAYNYFWGKDVGFGVGSLMPYHVYGLELPVRGSGLSLNHNIAYSWVGWPGKTLKSGEETYVGTSMIGVVDGDVGSGMDMYGRTMDNVDITPFIDRGDFIARTDAHEGANWSYVVDGKDYAKPRYSYNYGGDYKGVPKNLLELPKGDEVAPWALKPIWETWGYGTSIAPRALFYLVPILTRLGYGSVVYDAHWYNRDGGASDPLNMPRYTGQPDIGSGSIGCDWNQVAPLLEEYFKENPHSMHKIPGDPYDFSNLNTLNMTEAIKVVRAMNEYIAEHGMKAIAWTMTSLQRPGTVTSGRAPEWRTLSITGARHGTQLCTGNPEVINTVTTYMTEVLFGTGHGEMGFHGYKGDTIYGVNPCFDTGHGHDGDPMAPVRNYGLFFKNLYDKANYIRGATEYVGGPVIDAEKLAAVKQCMCGRVMDYYTYSGINRPIWGDHNGAKSNRQGNLIFRGFYGWDVPMDSDHHDCDFRGESTMVGDFDYAAALGTGMIFASKTRMNLNIYEWSMAERSSLMNWPGNENYNQKTGLRAMVLDSNYGNADGPGKPGAIKWGRALKYYGIYNDLKTSQTRMLDLYKYIVDYPEAYALELMDKDPVSGKLTEKPVSERIYSFYATSFPVEASDPTLLSTTGFRYYREVVQQSAGRRTYDPWNSVYKDIPNTTDRLPVGRAYSTSGNPYPVLYTPFKFVYVGPIEIRGLKANTAYCLTDVETGEKTTRTSNANGLIAFEATFANSVIYHVTEATTGSVTGMVYSGDGKILPGSTITLYNEDGEKVFWDTASDLDGYYSFPVVPAGKYYIAATFPKEYIVPQAGTAAVPNNDTRYNGFTPVNLDYFTNVYKFVSEPFTVGAGAFTFDMIVCIDHVFGPPHAIEGNLLQGIIYCQREGCDHSEIMDLPEITYLRIDANVVETVARGEVVKFGVILNEGAYDINLVWTVSDGSFALIDDKATIYLLNKTGTVRLIVTDPVSGLSHSITLRIAS